MSVFTAMNNFLYMDRLFPGTPFEIRRYPKLEMAREALKKETGVTHFRLWAEDYALRLGRKPGSKVYMVGGIADMYDYLVEKQHPCVYEIIDHQAGHYFYLDMDWAVRILEPPALPGLDVEEYLLVNSSAILGRMYTTR
ncbi:hypothetical protein K3495_g14240 [Podosphaera aphanis]|nr:hypothetical protein K3495_g14240 [Podosphaera aphanis]